MRNARYIGVVVIAGLFTATAALLHAQSPILAKMAGTWVMDLAQTPFSPGAELRFRRVEKGSIEELRGADPKPVVQPVMFDGKLYPVDGGSGSSIAWTQTTPTKFQRKIYTNGKLLATRDVSLSSDGKTLTEITDRVLPDGSHRISTAGFQRSAGEANGIVGNWTMTSSVPSTPPSFKMEVTGSALKYTNDQAVTWAAKLDNQPVPSGGPGQLTGQTFALKAVDGNTVAFTSFRNGVENGSGTFTLSADGKTFTRLDKDGSKAVFVKK